MTATCFCCRSSSTYSLHMHHTCFCVYHSMLCPPLCDPSICESKPPICHHAFRNSLARGATIKLTACANHACKAVGSLPSGKAATQRAPKHLLAQLLGSAQLHGALLPSIEGCCHASVPDPVGNGLASLLLAVEVCPGLPGSGHRLILQPAENAQLDAACCTGLHLSHLNAWYCRCSNIMQSSFVAHSTVTNKHNWTCRGLQFDKAALFTG